MHIFIEGRIRWFVYAVYMLYEFGRCVYDGPATGSEASRSLGLGYPPDRENPALALLAQKLP